LGEGETRVAYRVMVDKKTGKPNLKDLGVDRNSILKHNLQNRMAGLNWVDLAQDRNIVPMIHVDGLAVNILNN
jgi:hypothetical protein